MTHSNDLPELEAPAIARIIIARDVKDDERIYALNPQTKAEAVIDERDDHRFLDGIVGLTDTTIKQYTQGQHISAVMRTDTWEQWLATYPYAPTDANEYVPVTVCQVGHRHEQLSALSFLDQRKVIVSADEMRVFMSDLNGFSADRVAQGYSIVCRIYGGDWYRWLKRSEVDA